ERMKYLNILLFAAFVSGNIVLANSLSGQMKLLVTTGESEDDPVHQAMQALKKLEDRPAKNTFLPIVEFLHSEYAEVELRASKLIRQIPEWRELAIEMATSEQPRHRLLATKVLLMDRDELAFAEAYMKL